MSAPDLPDVTDPDIRRMVLRDHEPAEHWTYAGTLIAVRCSTCLNAWPCPSVKAARAAEETS